MLSDIYLYDKNNPDVHYPIYASNSGKLGFWEDTLQYKATAPWLESLTAGYKYYDKDNFEKAGKEAVVMRTDSKDRSLRVLVSAPEDIDAKIRTIFDDGRTVKKGLKDTIYVIRVSSNNNRLKDLRLSTDLDGNNLIDFTRDTISGYYTTAAGAVGYTVPTVFAWATLEDTTATILDWTKITAEKYRKNISLAGNTYEIGGVKPFTVSVWAQEPSLVKSYTGVIKVKWNPNLLSARFDWGLGKAEFDKDALRDKSEFNINVPKSINIEDVKPEIQEKAAGYFRTFESWQITDGVYSYVVRVTSVDREDVVTRTYKFNLLHPSSDATLSYLAVPGFELDPAFDPAITAYTVIVPSELESIDFIAVANHEKADVAGNRKHSLAGDSTFRILVTAEDETTKKTYNVAVTSNPHTGIQLVDGSSVQVYVSNQSLHVSTPAAERVSVYSAGGQLLYSLDKPAGKAFVSTFPKGVLIVKGSSGWVKKVALH
jgi:hypothetical protein